MAHISSISFLSALLATAFCGCTPHADSETTSQQSVEQIRSETERAFAQEREADVVVFYDTARELAVQRPEPEQRFASEDALLTHLAERQATKRLLVVILSKRHEWSDPKQTLDGFWQVCKRAGFERVIIQQAAGGSRSILHE
jgi:hypothetical protein